MSQRISYIIKIVAFTVIGAAILVICNFIVQPIWSNANYNSYTGIYAEPENTIETLFVGSSHIRSGISTPELYENYGICAYDISTDGQPVMSSYYWIEEVYRLHPETLDTVVLDVGTIRKGTGSSNSHKAIDHMQFSAVKLGAVKAYSTDFTDFLYNMFPLLSYHERWKELTDEDFEKYNKEPVLCLRGYAYSTSLWISNASDYTELATSLQVLDEDAEDAKLNETSLKYFIRIVEFCKEHDIQLVLIKTPTNSSVWTSEIHNAVQTLADVYGLDFIDFNVDPYYSDIEFNLAANVVNPSDITNLHLNYYGATKLTDYMGQYLVEVCGNKDVRGEEKYSFMDEELDDYRRYIAGTTVAQYTDPCDYIEYGIQEDEYTVFISVKDDASNCLTEEQREYFASIGLTKLSELSYQESYLAVIENGDVIIELSQGYPEDKKESGEILYFEGVLPDGTDYYISSGGYIYGNVSSILINGTERSNNNRGLNIVLYDNKQEKYVAKASFDTYVSSERDIQNIEQKLEADLEAGVTLAEMSGTERRLYLYNRLCENEKTIKTLQNLEWGGLYQYLTAFWDDGDIDIYITVQNDASSVLTQELRTSLNELNLTELSEIEYQDSYLAVISGGEVIIEESSHVGDALELCTSKYIMRSVGSESEETSSIMIDGKEYTDGKDGIQIVIYDNITDSVIYSGSFTAVHENVSEEAA